MSRSLWQPYLPGLHEPEGGGAVVREIAASASPPRVVTRRADVEPPAVELPKPVDGFRVVRVERKPTYTLVLYRAHRPRHVPLSTLAGLALADEQPGVLLQAP